MTSSTPREERVGKRPAVGSQMALRTYLGLRLSAIGVIAVLLVSVAVEYHEAGNCLLGSISQYYFTSVQSVFVGSLVAMGLVMVVLWGKTALEDAFLTLAGLLAPVVAFAPTGRPIVCGVTNPSNAPAGTPPPTGEGARNVVNAGEDAVLNNMLSYLVVVGAVLVVLLVVRIHALTSSRRRAVIERKIAFWVTWCCMAALVSLIAILLRRYPGWIYDGLHTFAAAGMFGLVLLAIVTIGFQKLLGIKDLNEPAHRGWAISYFGLAGTMVLVLTVLALVRLGQHEQQGDWYYEHWVFVIEAVSLACLAAFWVLQTWDRWQVDAPPRTEEERRQLFAATQDAPTDPTG